MCLDVEIFSLVQLLSDFVLANCYLLLPFVVFENWNKATYQWILKIFPKNRETIEKSLESLQNKCKDIGSLCKLHQKVHDSSYGCIHTIRVLQNLTLEIYNIFLLDSLVIHIHLYDDLRLKYYLAQELFEGVDKFVKPWLLLFLFSLHVTKQELEHWLALVGKHMKLILKVIALGKHTHQFFESLTFDLEFIRLYLFSNFFGVTFEL